MANATYTKGAKKTKNCVHGVPIFDGGSSGKKSQACEECYEDREPVDKHWTGSQNSRFRHIQRDNYGRKF